MKTAAIAVLAAVTAFAAAPAGAATFEEISQLVDPAAFAEADDEWRRLFVMRNGECGSYGSNGNRRIDVILTRYEALAAAVSSGDEAATMEAGAKFAETVGANDRFESCWSALARKGGVKSRLASAF